MLGSRHCAQPGLLAPVAQSLFCLLSSESDPFGVGQGCPGTSPGAGTGGGEDRRVPTGWRLAQSLRTSGCLSRYTLRCRVARSLTRYHIQTWSSRWEPTSQPVPMTPIRLSPAVRRPMLLATAPDQPDRVFANHRGVGWPHGNVQFSLYCRLRQLLPPLPPSLLLYTGLTTKTTEYAPGA